MSSQVLHCVVLLCLSSSYVSEYSCTIGHFLNAKLRLCNYSGNGRVCSVHIYCIYMHNAMLHSDYCEMAKAMFRSMVCHEYVHGFQPKNAECIQISILLQCMNMLYTIQICDIFSF